MKDSKHTPGPWGYAPAMQTGLTRPYERFDIFHITPPDRNNGYGINTGSQKKFIGVLRAQPSNITTESNARLISAAPELLEVLEMLVDAGYLDDIYAPTTDKVRAIIAKAKGQ